MPYKTNLESVLEDLYWIDRNIESRHILDQFKNIDIEWSKIPIKMKVLNEYYNFRQNKLIGGIKRLSAYDRSIVTEYFNKIKEETKILIIPAIPNQKLVNF